MPKTPFITIITGEEEWFNLELENELRRENLECQSISFLNKRVRFYDIYHSSNFLLNRIYSNELIPEYYNLIKEIANLVDIFKQLDFCVLNHPESFFFDISKLRTYLQLLKYQVPFPKFSLFEGDETLDLIKYPTIIKPNCSGKSYLTGIAQNKQEAQDFLNENLSKLQHDNFFILQDFIKPKNGAIFRVENFQEFEVALKADRMKRFLEGRFDILKDPDQKLLDIAHQVFSACHLIVGSVDLIQDENDKYYVVDINSTSKFTPETVNQFKFNPFKEYVKIIKKRFESKYQEKLNDD